jgi:hypothetical protein
MARPIGSKSKLPEVRAFVRRIENRLAKGGDTGGLEAFACRLMTHPAREAMETKFFAHEGVVTDSRETINWAARLKSAEIAAGIWRTLLQYKLGMPAQEIQHSGQILHTLTATEKKEAAESLKRIAAFAGDEDSEDVIDGEIVEE